MASNEEYSRAAVRRKFRLSERQLRSWEKEDLLSPLETYSFSDLITIQTLIDRFFATVPMADRMQLASQIVHHVTDHLVFLPLFYDQSPTMVSNRLLNAPRRLGRTTTPTWNAHLWDVQRS